jgi:hypothetical protein
LYFQYVILGKSAVDIADEQGCSENNILHWLAKHSIPRRTISEARQIKKWGLRGKANGMFGMSGAKNPNWKGGHTPERQAFYASQEWKEVSQKAWGRDGGMCQRCGGSGEHVHHIVSFAVEEVRANLDNLIILCVPCHHWVHSRENIEADYVATS